MPCVWVLWVEVDAKEVLNETPPHGIYFSSIKINNQSLTIRGWQTKPFPILDQGYTPYPLMPTPFCFNAMPSTSVLMMPYNSYTN
jgi:hypothetical protein